MSQLTNAVTSFLIIGTLVSLIVIAWDDGFKKGYEITEEATDGGDTVFDRLKSLNLIEGINRLQSGLFKATNPAGIGDLLGGLALIGLGFVQTIAGIVIFPIDIIVALSPFYYIPPPVKLLIEVGVATIIAIMLIRARMRTDV